MRTVEDVIEACGGARRIEDHLGLKSGAVRKWRQFGYVPGLRLIDVAELAGIPVEEMPRRRSAA